MRERYEQAFVTVDISKSDDAKQEGNESDESGAGAQRLMETLRKKLATLRRYGDLMALDRSILRPKNSGTREASTSARTRTHILFNYISQLKFLRASQWSRLSKCVHYSYKYIRTYSKYFSSSRSLIYAFFLCLS